MNDPFRETDDEARDLAQTLLLSARYGALAVSDQGVPFVSRIALVTERGMMPMTLISDLAHHTTCLRTTPHASLLIGDVPDKGDPLVHPRMTLKIRAEFVEKDEVLLDRYLFKQPKAKLYARFADFNLVRLTPEGAILNGGFGKAYKLSREDLLAPSL